MSHQMKRRDFLHCMGLGAATALAGRNVVAQSTAKKPINIVYILADDMGYGDVACQNAESKIPTPIWIGWRHRACGLPMPTPLPLYAHKPDMGF